MTGASGGSAITRIVGLLIFLGAWEAVGRSGVWGDSFPALSTIAQAFSTEGQRSLLRRSLARTAQSAALGLVLGAALALVLACCSSLWPRLRRGLDSLATGVYAIPTITFGPIFILVAGPDSTPMVLSALSAYFPIFVALDAGLRFAPAAQRDLPVVLGATRARAFMRVEFPSAVPAFVDGLRLGAPGAVLGAVLGEWFGAPRGLGVLIISSLQNVRIPQLWAAALLCVACSLGAYVVLSLVHRWAQRRYAW
jgi:ABC-type nitrate/sulfonate/bicarbonate transport system permease component